jgi:hypothetical protein
MRICVFCGSNAGRSPEHVAAAQTVGRVLAEKGIGLVYGGGKLGLMGVLADAALAYGGTVTGVVPHALVLRQAHKELKDLRIVRTMHERKAMMASLADAFIALPGGVGTLEEIFEVWSWARLGQHGKPCCLLNVEGFYDGLLAFLDHAGAEGFLGEVDHGMLIVKPDIDDLLHAIASYTPPTVPRWISDEET